MATNTSGGTTASLSNTPQAKDDSFNLVEDYNAITWLDVMANDLGGNAKILWSLDDSATDAAGATDLIGSDIGKVEATTCDTSLNGAKIWICDGKVGYDASTLSASFRASLQALAVGEKTYDSFTYAIRLSNGTLSWGTATVVYTGTNDGPDISVATGDSASACLTETNATLSTNGTLTVVDPDNSDTVAVSITGFSKSGNAGSLSDATLEGMLALTESSLAADTGDTHNLHWSFNSNPQTFDYLAAGECLTLTYTVKADDGHTGTDTQTITITIKGTNDGPAIVAGGTLSGAIEEESGTYSAGGSFGFTDVDSNDTHTVSVTSDTTGFLGTLTPSVSNDSTGDGSGTVSWSFSVSNDDLQFLGEGETRAQDYTVTVNDGHGGTTSQTVQIVLTGDEDPIVITSAAQSKSISEDGTSVGGAIAFNDVDLSDTHTASAAANAANTTSLGTFSIDASVTEDPNAANGSLGWSYAVDNSAAQYLAAGQSVVEKYDVTFNDAHGSIVTETVTVTITGSNDGPDIRAEAGDTASHDFDETDSGLSTSGTLTVTDPDTSDTIDTSAAIAVSGNQGSLSDGDLLAMFHITGGTENDLAANTGDANNLSWSFDSESEAFDFLAEGQVLTLTYTLTSVDGHGGSDSQDVTITITGTNDDPVLSASVTSGTYTDTAADDSFSNLSGTLSTADPDSGDTAAYSVSGGAPDNSHLGYDTSASSAYGTLYLNSSSGAYLFVPDDTAIEALTTDDSVGFTLTVTDSQGASDSETLTINVDGANDTPELSATLTSATFTDTAGDDSFSAASGDLSSTDRDSPDTATYGVLGGVSDNSLSGYDTSKATAFGTLYVDSTSGNYTFVPDDGAIEGLKTNATLFFTLKVTDGSGATDTETLTVSLAGANDTPDLGAVTDASYNDTAADDTFANVTGTLTSADRDAGDSASYSVTGGSATAELGFDQEVVTAYGTLYLDSASGNYKFVPNDGAIEGLKTTDHVDFVVSVTDGDGASDSDTLTITLNGVNDTPDAPLTNSVTTDEDTASSAVAVGASDRDASDVLTYSVKAGEEPSIGSVSFDQGAGTFIYTPDSNANGSDSFTIVITDADGATTEQVVSVTVNPVNDAPESANGSGSTDEDTPLSDSLPGATDVDGDSVTYALDTDGANGSALVNTDGTFTYTPDENFNGSDSFSFTVSDGHGGSNTYTYDVTVNPVNDVPESANGSGSTDEDTPLSDSLPGATDVDGDSVTYALDTDGANGSAVVNADGTFTYTPDENFNGSDSFSFTVSDGHGGSNTYTYDVTINPVNDAPVANNDSFGTAEDTPVTFDVRSNDSDVDGDALSVTKINGTAISVGSPVAITGGSISLGLDGQLTYTPTANFNGTPSFTYTLSDGHGGTSVATVNLTVTAVDDAPVNTLPATFSTNEDTSVQLTGLSVADVDAGSGAISVTLGVGSGSLTAANGGGVTVAGSGTGSLVLSGTLADINAYLASASAPTYVPVANANGSVTLTMTTNDGGNTGAGGPLSDTDTSTINIAAVNDAPVNEVPATQTINEDGSITFSAGNANAIKVSDIDLSGGNLTVTLSVAHGNLTLSQTTGLAFSVGDGTSDGTMTFSGTQAAINAAMQGLVYAPTADYNGSDTLTITSNDNGNTGSGGAKSDSDTVTINLNAVADIVADSVSVNANSGPNNLDLLANDSFENAGRFISAVGAASHGTVSINNNGTPGNLADDFVVYTPNAGYSGSDSFTYTVTSGGVTETATVSVAVNAADALSPTDIVFNLNPASSSFSGNGLGTGDVLGSFTAVDADSTTWTFTLAGANASLFSLSPSGSQSSVSIAAASAIAAGNYTFTVTATDGAGHSFTETYHVGVGTTGGDAAGAFTVTTGTDVDFGLNGQDVINGGAGDDALVGGQNSDTITGGGGADQLIGGQLSDTFVYTATSDSTSASHDTIFDFEEAGNGDVIDLSAIDANTATPIDNAFVFGGQTSAVQNNSVTWFQDVAHNTTIVQADNNGDGVADLMITLTGLHTLTAGDFGL